MQPRRKYSKFYNIIISEKHEMHRWIETCLCLIILPMVIYVTPKTSTLGGICFSLWFSASLFSGITFYYLKVFWWTFPKLQSLCCCLTFFVTYIWLISITVKLPPALRPFVHKTLNTVLKFSNMTNVYIISLCPIKLRAQVLFFHLS